MESAVRYDFSFPPKSSNMNGLHSVQSLCSISSSGNGMSMNGNSGMGGSMHHQQQQQHHHNHQQQHHVHSMQRNHHHNNNNNNNRHQNIDHQNYNAYNQQNIGLSKSASTSLLSCVSQHNGNIPNNNNNNLNINLNHCKGGNCCNNCYPIKDSVNNNHLNNNHNNNHQKNNKHHNQGHYNSNNNNNNKNNMQSIPNHQPNGSHNNSNINQQSNNKSPNHQINPHNLKTPATPKDGNCSFTFDDLKNTLAFMEDSPLINSNHQGNNSNANINTSHVSASATTVLTVIPNAHLTDCPSSLSSSSSTASSTSCNSCCASNYLPKSNSNPMIQSSSVSPNSTSSHSSTGSSLLIKADHSNHKGDCGCNGNNTGYNHNVPINQVQSIPNDLLLRKSSPTALNSTSALLIEGDNKSGPNNVNTAIESAAKKYRCAAQISEATCCWKGKLPPKQYKTPIVYSTKVFVGGLPWDITEEDIIKEFGVFGLCRVEWTNKEKYNLIGSGQQLDSSPFDENSNLRNSFRNGSNRSNSKQQNNSDSMNSSKHRMSPGFAYVIYESEYSVKNLVSNCIEDYQNGRDRVEYYFKISTRRVRNKEVQIIPWILADNNFALCTPKELDPKKTVFVGNLHGTMTARDLAHIMNELFGCVVYAGIDIDKLKYPIGSGRVTFSHQQNFMRAVRAAFVDIQASKFSKRIQIDPYLEDVQCCSCYSDKGVYFCRDFQCFNYYCGICWEKQHVYNNQFGNHKPLMRKREDK